MKIYKFLSKLTLVLLSIIISNKSHGFLNIESLRQNDKSGFYGSAHLKASGASGNTDTFSGNISSQNIYKENTHEFLFLMDYTYGEASNTKNTHLGSLHLRYTQHFTPTFAYEVFSQLEFNEFTSLEMRKLFGAGLRSRLLTTDRNSLFLGTGAFYEHEELSIDPDQKVFRGNIYLSYRLLLENSAEATLILYYQPSTKFIEDYRIQLVTGLDFPLTRNLNFTTEFRYSYDSRPPTDIKMKDISYLTGLSYSY